MEDVAWQNSTLQIFICFHHFFVPFEKKNEKNLARPGFELKNKRLAAQHANHYTMEAALGSGLIFIYLNYIIDRDLNLINITLDY